MSEKPFPLPSDIELEGFKNVMLDKIVTSTRLREVWEIRLLGMPISGYDDRMSYASEDKARKEFKELLRWEIDLYDEAAKHLKLKEFKFDLNGRHSTHQIQAYERRIIDKILKVWLEDNVVQFVRIQ